MNEWISVEDKLPEKFMDVLCWCISLSGPSIEPMSVMQKYEQYASIDRYCKWNDGYKDSFRTSRFYDAKVTHWMPLPEPPKNCYDSFDSHHRTSIQEASQTDPS